MEHQNAKLKRKPFFTVSLRFNDTLDSSVNKNNLNPPKMPSSSFDRNAVKKTKMKLQDSVGRDLVKSDNGSDHRAGTIDLQAEKSTRKSGFACITLLSGVVLLADQIIELLC